MEEGHSVAVLVPKIEDQEAVLISETIIDPTQEHVDDGPHFKGTDPLKYVIQKLSKIVENEKSRRCILNGKRSYSNNTLSLGTQGIRSFPSKNIERPTMPPPKKIKDEVATENGRESLSQSNRNSVCYQCSLCKFICASFDLLNEHIKQHGEHNEVILMCSECHFTSKQQEELEVHIRNHCESNKNPAQVKVQPQQDSHLSKAEFQGSGERNDKSVLNRTNWDSKDLHVPGSTSVTEMGIRKWYTYEQYGMYRCLICSYTCGQQRMLKTHAWKHAGEVDCSYPIFEDENEPASLPDTTVAQTPHGSEAAVLSIENEVCIPSHRPVQLQVCTAEQFSQPSLPKEAHVKETEALGQATTPTLAAEIVLEEESMSDTEQENLLTDSLLSSAQKIISCSENAKGHVNVIVERLPSAEERVLQKPFLRSADVNVEKKLISEESQQACKEYIYHAEQNTVGIEEILIGWCNPETPKIDLTPGDGKAASESAPPIRQRTNSESLRLHSLAAEALVTMPIRAAELTRTSFKPITEVCSIDPDTGQRPTDPNCTAHPKIGSSVNYSEEVNNLNWIDPEFVDIQGKKPDLADVPVKMGISMSLLTVIEKLRERTDQNVTDEDILRELQDNAQCQPSIDTNLSGTDLVEYISNVDRPYRCRLCHYSSDSKGYIKQHLRVHRQRQPYQCPICEHIAEDSKDLESHMINHCKTRMYQCKQCEESFYYKSQLRNHEREQHSLPDTLSATTEGPLTPNDVVVKFASEDQSSAQIIYKCDICEYTSTTYIGVRNHRRIHNSDKPYRCRLCDFAATNLNSLKCHMKRHPQEHQSVQLMEQYKCSLCGYVCSHPPSLKSHMWKHAGDQNYNYEQVNKAINDAISQSSRIQEESQSSVQDGVEETSKSILDSSENLMSLSELASQTSSTMIAPGEPQKTGFLMNQACSLESRLNQPRPGMEYCILLFCCCICGFESTSKEHLMDHMKEHEGEIINIILSKDQNATQNTN